MKPVDSDGLYFDGRHYDEQHRGIYDDIPFYLGQARKHGDPVLELACGTGRITIPLAAEGIEITGLDVSEAMLAQAKRRARESSVEVTWVRSDCRGFKFSERFRLIFIAFNSVAHLHDPESIGACFRCVKDHLAGGGRFVVDIFNPRLDVLIRDARGRYPVAEYQDPDGRGTVVITENNVYDAATQINRIKWYYRIGDSAEETVEELNMRIFYPCELDALLGYGGFVIESKYGDFEGNPFTSESQKQIIVCRLP